MNHLDCLTDVSNFVSEACLYAWPQRQTLLGKELCLSMFMKLFKNILCLSQAKIFADHMFV